MRVPLQFLAAMTSFELIAAYRRDRVRDSFAGEPLVLVAVFEHPLSSMLI